MKRIWIALLMLTAALFVGLPAQAQVNHATVKINGMI